MEIMSRKKLKIGVSACLLGIKCRYDGKAKGDPRIYELLKDKVDLIPICPEFNCGLGIRVPRCGWRRLRKARA